MGFDSWFLPGGFFSIQGNPSNLFPQDGTPMDAEPPATPIQCFGIQGPELALSQVLDLCFRVGLLAPKLSATHAEV